MLSTGWKNFFRVIPEYEYFEYPKELRRVWFIVTYIAIVLLVVEIAVVLPQTKKKQAVTCSTLYYSARCSEAASMFLNWL